MSDVPSQNLQVALTAADGDAVLLPALVLVAAAETGICPITAVDT